MSLEPAALAQRLRGLSARRAGLAVCLWGEAGVGKTHTAQELLRETPCRSVSVHAASHAPALIRALPRPARWPQWAQRALDAAATGQDVGPAALGAALSAQLAALSPFVLHVEDLHEAGPERLTLLMHLAQTARTTRGVGLVTTSRLPPPGALESLRVERLNLPAAQALIQGQLGAGLPAEAARWVYGRAAGNPLFTLEYVRLLTRQGALWNDGETWHWRAPDRAQTAPLPTTVEAVIGLVVRAAARSAALQPVLAARAVLEPGADRAVWAQVAGCDASALEDACQELTRSGVLLGDELIHPLYREVLLTQLDPAALRAAARRALHAAPDDPHLVADLVERAGLDAGEALGWLTGAAERALARGHRIEAGRLYARACVLAPPAEAGRLALLAATELRGSDPVAATQLAGRAALHPEQFRAATWLQSELLAQQGRLADAEGCLERLPAGDTDGAAGVLRRLTLRAAARNHSGVLALWSAHPEVQRDPEPDVVAAVAFASATNGLWEQAAALARATLSRPDLEVVIRCRLTSALGAARYGVNDFAGAQGYYGQAAALAHGAGLEQLETQFLANRAIATGERGHHREMAEELEAIAQRYADAGQVLALARTQVSLADARLDLGEYRRSEALLLEARDLLRQLGASEHLIECEYRLSVLYRHWAPPHGAILAVKHAHSALEQARLLANPRSLVWSLAYAAIAEARGGDAAAGHSLALEAQALAATMSSPGLSGMARFALAHALEAAGRPLEALHVFEEVETTLRAQGIDDAANEVGLEADRLAGRPERAAVRAAWFREREMVNLDLLAQRYFPVLNPGAGPEVRAPVQDTAPRLLLQVLGDLRLGPPAAPQPVRGRQRRALLAALLEARLRGQAEASRLELVGALYAGTDEPSAAAALKELIHQTRAALGPSVIRTTAGGYALGDLDSDAEAFLTTGDTRLWRGPYLSGVELEPDGMLQGTLYQALQAHAETRLDSDPAEAARLGRLLSEADPYDPPALALTLRALRAAGNHRTLKRVYDAARVRWHEVGDMLPDDWAAFLARPGSGAPA